MVEKLIHYELHIENYGSDNHLRLTGKFETQSIDKFSWGVSDRGASIRVPKSVGETWKGYLEDRRPSSNANPYKVIGVIYDALTFADQLETTIHAMYGDVDTSKIKEQFSGIMSDEELLKANSNQSMVHVDFMFGSKDLQVEGTQKDGKKVTIFKDGDFII